MAVSNQMMLDMLNDSISKGDLSGFSDPACLDIIRNKLKPFVPDISLNNGLTSNFLKVLRRKWQESNRTKDRFVTKNKTWLNVNCYEPPVITADSPKLGPGRPSVGFSEAADRTKRLKTAELAKSASSTELLHAASHNLRKDGQFHQAKIAKQLTSDDAAVLTKYTPHSAEKALALILDCGLSKAGYQQLRTSAVDAGCNLYPTYNDVRTTKQACMPPTEHWTIDDYSASINLQALLDHTAQRICTLQKSVLEANEHLNRVILRHKIGFDGSTGQSLYKQISVDRENRNLSEEGSIFLTCLVPLQLTGYKDTTKLYIWSNPRPSSTMYCRPVRFRFIKETTEISIAEEAYINHIQQHLVPTRINETLEVIHILDITMIDGKVATALSNVTNSAQCCSLCGATPTQMNDIPKLVKNQLTPEGLQFGLSTLHAWIRCMECLLHIAYKLNTQKWQARTVNDKASVAATKQEIQDKLRNELGLIVDIPKAGGSGTSNDGNTARRFFSNEEDIARITKLDVTLIHKMYIVLQTLSSGMDIDADLFQDYCYNVATLYVNLYPWYNMPQSLHRILIHGHQVIRRMVLPIGMLSEEAQEARNKDMKKYREQFSRKCSRRKTNEDVLRRLLCSSDPIISSLRRVTVQKTNFSPEAIKLFKAPNLPGIVNLI